MTTVGSDEGRNYARVNLKLTDRGDRSRSQKEIERAIRSEVKSIPGIELTFGFNRPVWVNLLGPDPQTLATLIGEFAEKVARVPGIADLETSEKAAAPALSIRLNNDAAADVGVTVQQVGATIRPLLAGDTVSYWLGPDGQNYEVNVQLPKDSRRLAADLGNLYLSTTKRGPRRRGADGPAAAGRRDRRDDVAADHQAPGAAAARRAVRQRRGAPFGGREQGRAEDHQGVDAAARLPVRRRRPGEEHGGSVPGGACRAGPRRDLHLPDPRLAVRELHAAVRDHGVAAVLADRRVSRAAPDRHDAQSVLDDRLHHADGPGDEERDPARRLRQPRPPRRGKPARLAAAGRPGAAAADHDDDGGDDRRHAAAGPRAGRGRGNPGADGPRDHRRRDHVDAADAGGRARALHVPRHCSTSGARRGATPGAARVVRRSRPRRGTDGARRAPCVRRRSSAPSLRSAVR